MPAGRGSIKASRQPRRGEAQAQPTKGSILSQLSLPPWPCIAVLSSRLQVVMTQHRHINHADSAGPTVDRGAPCTRCSPLLGMPSAKLTQTPTSLTSHPCWGLQNPMRPHYPCSTWSSCKALLTRPTTNARTYGFETSGHMLNTVSVACPMQGGLNDWVHAQVAERMTFW